MRNGVWNCWKEMLEKHCDSEEDLKKVKTRTKNVLIGHWCGLVLVELLTNSLRGDRPALGPHFVCRCNPSVVKLSNVCHQNLFHANWSNYCIVVVSVHEWTENCFCCLLVVCVYIYILMLFMLTIFALNVQDWSRIQQMCKQLLPSFLCFTFCHKYIYNLFWWYSWLHSSYHL